MQFQENKRRQENSRYKAEMMYGINAKPWQQEK